MSDSVEITIKNFNENSDLYKFLDLLSMFVLESEIEFSKEKIESYFANDTVTIAGKLELKPEFSEYKINSDSVSIGLETEQIYKTLTSVCINSILTIIAEPKVINLIATKPRKNLNLKYPCVDKIMDKELKAGIIKLIETTKDRPKFEITEEFANDLDACGNLATDVVTFLVKTDETGKDSELTIKSTDQIKEFIQQQKVNIFNFKSSYEQTENYSAEYLHNLLQPLKYTTGTISIEAKSVIRLDYKIGNISLTLFLAPRIID